MMWLRSLAGWVALVSYLVMGATLYFTILPGAAGHWPPDFHVRGYDVESMTPFVTQLSSDAQDAYARLLTRWDPVFILSLAVWLVLTGWRGTWLRYAVTLLAVTYACVDLLEDWAIYQFVIVEPLDPDFVAMAHHLTMAKFTSLYLCALVLLVHVRRMAPG